MTVPPMVRDDEWFKRFQAELQLRGATGRQVGDAVAEVDAHCRESGEDPEEAFGDPVAYAAALHPHQHLVRYAIRILLPLVVAMLGLQASAWLPLALTGSRSTRCGMLLPYLVWTVAGVVAMWVWPRAATTGRRMILLFVLYFAANMASGWVRDSSLGQHVWTIPVLFGWVYVLAACALAVVATRRGLHNRVVDPRSSRYRTTWPAGLVALAPWVLPIAVVLVVLVRIPLA